LLVDSPPLGLWRLCPQFLDIFDQLWRVLRLPARLALWGHTPQPATEFLHLGDDGGVVLLHGLDYNVLPRLSVPRREGRRRRESVPLPVRDDAKLVEPRPLAGDVEGPYQAGFDFQVTRRFGHLRAWTTELILVQMPFGRQQRPPLLNEAVGVTQQQAVTALPG